ncbi:hypothetical protein TMatcc_002863 [Talaromyces marneffei ATCC 18224]|uniref:Uncharacterized protein n=2 Tax=Talaromyces marneffei TaxID=37727 RepID=B6Q7Q1_TALMQ|nr:uncharacterized protein EYB26_002053 [Talaromyces marneffei]EEA28786.1 conserved hypothetical protein [Talaromyces marneffei ATCC 18224]KAE8555602.1 hypothetical protein EYB25_000300 [Talaromyces marneffei]QGA14400.1 hypothetical protein EYB26_002053 [Talaromyces marneffei]
MSDLDYNDLLPQISTNLSNTLNTWGASSHQYQAVLQTLKDLLQRIEQRDAQLVKSTEIDADMLSQAMEFLKLG